MKSLLLLLFLGLSLNWKRGEALVSPNDLQDLSAQGSKYIGNEFENALNGVKQMKSLMDKTGKDRRMLLDNLEETKKQKEEAIREAKNLEKQMVEKPEVCNDTMLALWEECKPCLKQTCMKFYTKVCRSGSGLVGRQLEEFLNQSSPFSIWINGDRMDTLLKDDQEQKRRLMNLEENYSLVQHNIDELFQGSLLFPENPHPFLLSPFRGVFDDSPRPPFRPWFLQKQRVVRDIPPFFSQHPVGFQHLFQPLFEMSQRLIESAHRAMEREKHWNLSAYHSSDNGTNDRMVCREIRRNSAGCLKMKDQCEKCREILSVDCSDTDPNQSQLREKYEDALRIVEKFDREYEDLLQMYQLKMLNTSSLLDQLNQQFGWVSRLANLTQSKNGDYLQVSTVYSRSSNPEDPSKPSDTEVVVQLFDSEPITLTVPAEISWDDPKFMEIVADEALKQYKKKNLENQIV
ncbi:clusterin [Trichosurus vulpecula]|uniref:clusterin n=1 Tax=Trichosurus vulpecula TaxID=9337 RepID=UPI00186ADDF3|nr:clusterin [Trichosurus vulpecula]